MTTNTLWVTSVGADQQVHVRPWLAKSLDDLLTSHDETYPGEHVLAVGDKRPVETDLHLSLALQNTEV